MHLVLFIGSHINPAVLANPPTAKELDRNVVFPPKFSIPGAQRYLSSTVVTKWIGNVKEAPNPAILQGYGISRTIFSSLVFRVVLGPRA
jgi:hypothetical protein